VLEWRERARLYKSLVDQRTIWCQRIHAELYHHGVSIPEGAIRTAKTRAMLADPGLGLSPAARERIEVSYRMIDATNAPVLPLQRELQWFGTHQPACKALVDAQYGIGGLLAVVLWSELGDCRRFSRSEQVVRHTRIPGACQPAATSHFSHDRVPASHCHRRPRHAQVGSILESGPRLEDPL
jgi:transposase